jgi:hypothetical protein
VPEWMGWIEKGSSAQGGSSEYITNRLEVDQEISLHLVS